MVAFYRLLKGRIVRMIMRNFTSVISQDKMILEWSLEWLAHQILDGDYLFTSGQPGLNKLGFGVDFQQIFDDILSVTQILEIVRIDKHEFCILLHNGSNHRCVSIPLFENDL